MTWMEPREGLPGEGVVLAHSYFSAKVGAKAVRLRVIHQASFCVVFCICVLLRKIKLKAKLKRNLDSTHYTQNYQMTQRCHPWVHSPTRPEGSIQTKADNDACISTAQRPSASATGVTQHYGRRVLTHAAVWNLQIIGRTSKSPDSTYRKHPEQVCPQRRKLQGQLTGAGGKGSGAWLLTKGSFLVRRCNVLELDSGDGCTAAQTC